MRRLGKHTRGVLRAALACGMGVQILLGLAWLMHNMGGLQNFQESRLLLAGESAESGFYSGVLYRGLVSMLSPCLWLLYGIQLTAAVGAAYGLTCCLFGREKKVLRLFCALALVTFPQAMQCHLAVLPWSLGTSLLLVETALWRRAWGLLSGRGGEAARGADGENGIPRAAVRLAVALLLGWLLLLLLLPLYACFALPLPGAFLWKLGKRWGRKGRMARVLTVLALVLCSITVNWGWNPVQWNRKLSTAALSRTGWPYFQHTYQVFPQPLHDEIGLVIARDVSAYADGVERVLIPRLEELYGAGETSARLWELAGICLRDNLKADAKNVIWDMAAYHAAPPILAMQLKGRAYDSYSGVNYQQMKGRAPLLTRYYVTYGSRWWWAMLGLAAAAWACGWLPGGLYRKKAGRQPGSGDSGSLGPGKTPGLRLWSRGRRFLGCWLPVLAGVEWMILHFVLCGSGIMDYKKTLWVTALWYLAALWPLAGGEGSSEWQS